MISAYHKLRAAHKAFEAICLTISGDNLELKRIVELALELDVRPELLILDYMTWTDERNGRTRPHRNSRVEVKFDLVVRYYMEWRNTY